MLLIRINLATFGPAPMKKILLLCILFLLVVSHAGATTHLGEFLEKIGARDVQVLESESNYEKIVEVMIEQPLDHRNPEGE